MAGHKWPLPSTVLFAGKQSEGDFMTLSQWSSPLPQITSLSHDTSPCSIAPRGILGKHHGQSTSGQAKEALSSVAPSHSPSQTGLVTLHLLKKDTAAGSVIASYIPLVRPWMSPGVCLALNPGEQQAQVWQWVHHYVRPVWRSDCTIFLAYSEVKCFLQTPPLCGVSCSQLFWFFLNFK